ncbi:MAG: hypothetical protein HY423_10315 [Candidatus Lambdaproteobacteria bacterium]|nr:hypothetical protein [Candidatus Lambdaproteobacteria bacterium]
MTRRHAFALLLAAALAAVLPALAPAAAQAQGSPREAAPVLTPMQAPTGTAPGAAPGSPAPGEGIAPAAPGLRERAERALEAARPVWNAAWEPLKGQSLTVGGGYAQATLKFPGLGGDATANPQLTDNGRVVPFIQYETAETYFKTYPLRGGQAALGYSLVVHYATFSADRQLRTSAFAGDDLGTRVSGDYAAAAPQVFVRLGPLYPDRRIFWKFAGGLGAGLVRFDGTVLPHSVAGETEQPVGHGAARLSLFTAFAWELQVDAWVLAFSSRYLGGYAANRLFTYELYSLSLGYSFRF